MAKDDIKARLLATVERNKATGFGPGSMPDEPIRPRPTATTEPFDKLDLSAWGIDSPDLPSPQVCQKRIRLTLTERHWEVVEAFAAKARMTPSAALEVIIEKFVESGEFARLMDRLN